MNELTNWLSSHSQQVLEWTAVIFGVLCVALNTRENIWGWPTGLVSVGIYIYIFLQAKLYSDSLLNGFFFATGVYGWYHWYVGNKASKQVDDLPVTKLGTTGWLWSIGLGLVFLLGLGFFFDAYTDADLAYWDAYTTAFSLVAQVLMARKVLENWLLWIAVDIIAIGIYFYKGLYPTSLLFAIYLLLAIYGYWSWSANMRRQMAVSAGGAGIK